MATRTALGTAQTKSVPDPWTALSSIALNAGDTLCIYLTGQNAPNYGTVEWNGTSVPGATAGVINSTHRSRTFVLGNVSGGTGDIVVSGLTGAAAVALIAVKWSGLTTSPVDAIASAAGSSTTPDSGNTATTAQADEVLWGGVSLNEDDSPSWGSAASGSDLNTAGSQVITTGSGGPSTEAAIQEYYDTVSATGAYNLARTGTTNTNWGSHVVTLKIQATDDQQAWLPRSVPIMRTCNNPSEPHLVY